MLRKKVHVSNDDGDRETVGKLAVQKRRSLQRVCCFLQQEMQRYKEVCYYMLFALAAYGWPIYLMRKPTCGLCRLARSCS